MPWAAIADMCLLGSFNCICAVHTFWKTQFSIQLLIQFWSGHTMDLAHKHLVDSGQNANIEPSEYIRNQ